MTGGQNRVYVPIYYVTCVNSKRISKRGIVNFRRSEPTFCWKIVMIFVFLENLVYGLINKISFLEQFVI